MPSLGAHLANLSIKTVMSWSSGFESTMSHLTLFPQIEQCGNSCDKDVRVPSIVIGNEPSPPEDAALQFMDQFPKHAHQSQSCLVSCRPRVHWIFECRAPMPHKTPFQRHALQLQSLLSILSTRSPRGPQKSLPLAKLCSSMKRT